MDKPKEEKILECCQYFKERTGFHRLLCGIRDKYLSLSRCGGSVTLTGLKIEEKEALEGFFQKSYAKNKSVTVSVEKFQKMLRDTKFSEVSLEELLEAYFGESLESKREKKAREEREWAAFFCEVLSKFQGTFGGGWLSAVLENGSVNNAYTFLKQLYGEDKSTLKKVLFYVLMAANSFPIMEKKTLRLALFAARVSGNPHYFDEGTKANRLLSYAMEYYIRTVLNLEPMGAKSGGAYLVETKHELMFRVGLLKDDISNSTIVYGIRCRLDNGEFHQGIEGFFRERQPVTLMLYAFRDIVSAYASDNRVYVVENPSVFSALVDASMGVEISVVCTSGQLTLTSLLLLDLLAESGCTIYYAGDFDPEGLQIAEKLKVRFGEKLVLWHYLAADYERAKSKVKLEEKRLSKLKSVQTEELQEIKEFILKERRAGYQEGLVEEYVADVKEKKSDSLV